MEGGAHRPSLEISSQLALTGRIRRSHPLFTFNDWTKSSLYSNCDCMFRVAAKAVRVPNTRVCSSVAALCTSLLCVFNTTCMNLLPLRFLKLLHEFLFLFFIQSITVMKHGSARTKRFPKREPIRGLVYLL